MAQWNEVGHDGDGYMEDEHMCGGHGDYEEGCCDARGPCHGAVDLFEDDDGPTGPTYEWTPGGLTRVYNDPDAEPGPYCPRDAREMIDRCAYLLFGAAAGRAVPPQEAGNAARDAVRLLEMYGVDEEPWYQDALHFGADESGSGE